MGSQKGYGDLILEAIDQLRKRKARPDLERICHMLERRHGLKTSDVQDQLNKLVEEGVVIKVDYKGNTSYRNAAKWVRTKSHYFANFCNTSDISATIIDAVETLSSSVPDSPTHSVSIGDIENFFLNKDSPVTLSSATLRAVLDKEVGSGSILQLPNGNFFMPKESVVEKKTDMQDVKKDSVEPVAADECCEYCLLGTESNRKGVPEKLLVCEDCSARAHPSCVDDPAESSPWQCPDCKVCIVCSYSSDAGPMLFCTSCGKGYHHSCHAPPIKSKPIENWICRCCKSEDIKPMFNSMLNEIKCEEQQYNSNSVDIVFRKGLEDYPDIVPLADDWDSRQVEIFIECLGYENEASAFRDQDIDGRSLLLMKRSDVLTGLDIKLGPALKIYEHIVRLQSVQPDEM